MEFVFYAPVWGQSGFEQLSRGLILALDQMGVNIELRPANDWNREKVGLPQETVSRLMRLMNTRVNPNAPHVIYQLPRGQVISPNAPAICYTLFETDRCPSAWTDSLNKMDKVFVFSEFNRKGWAESGIDENRIAALPPAIDSFQYSPDGPAMNIKNKKGFVFLTSGDFTERKNFEAVLEAYCKEFNGDDPVTLIMKIHYGGFTKKFRRACANKIREAINTSYPKNPPRVLFYGDKISDHAMAALYRSADCFVLTSRGEGLGMQYLEAMATGVPIIHANWSAHTDFLNETNSYPVKCFLKTIDDPNYIMKCVQALNSKWCQVYIEDLQVNMRYVMDNYGEARKKADVALEQVREMTWQRMAIAFIKQVIQMYDKAPAKPVEVMI